MTESTVGLAALRPQFRVDVSRGEVAASESHGVAIDATVVAVLRGAYCVEIAGAAHSVAEGSMALIDSGLAFRVNGEGDRITMTMSQSLLSEAVVRHGRQERGPVVFSKPVCTVHEALAASIRRLVLELASHGERRGEALDLVMALVAFDIVGPYSTTDRMERLERSRAGLVDRRLRRSVEFMHDNFHRELSLTEIAEAAYLSEFHFARLFKRITGVTPHTYLAGLRIEQARRLLAATDRSISDVAASVGYQSASHFGKVFRQATGFPPREYRELSRRG